jgi:hypothetical protein
MGRFCIASYTRALLSCAINGEGQASFCPKLFSLLEPSAYVTLSQESIRQILSGAQNLNPDWVNRAREMHPAKAARFFYQVVTPCIEPQKSVQLMFILKELIEEDSMLDSIELGANAHMTKEQFLKMTSIPFTEVLTDLFLYAVIHTDNTDQKSFVKKIVKKYYEKYNNRVEELNLYEAEAVKPLESIRLSLHGKSYERTFTRIHESTIGLTKPNCVQIFRVALDESQFVYDKLHEFVENSIGYYILSRARVAELEEDEESARIFPEGIRILKRHCKEQNKSFEDVLPELLRYSFLEKALSAPKILNSIELGRPGYLSNSIHLLKLLGEKEPIYQIVFGTSDMKGDLKSAIDMALEKIKEVKNNRTHEHELLDPSVLRLALPENEAKTVKQIILPDKYAVDRPKDAFGVFLGYTANIPDSARMSDIEFEAAVAAQLKKDVEDNIDRIYDGINSLGLEMHSFYIYLLPFNNVETDRKAITDYALGIGGET